MSRRIPSRGTHCVDLTKGTIEANKRFFASADDVPPPGLYYGIQTIMSARSKILVVVNRGGGQGRYRASFLRSVTPQVPASILQFPPGCLRWWAMKPLSKSINRQKTTLRENYENYKMQSILKDCAFERRRRICISKENTSPILPAMMCVSTRRAASRFRA